jgi:proline iminopeptidase
MAHHQVDHELNGDNMRQRRLCRLPVLFVAAGGLFACVAQQPLPDDGFVDVPGGRVAFRVIGGGDAVPVLLIHGGPGVTSCSYVSTVDGIASSRAVVVYDQLGSGNSDRMLDLERDATLPRFVREVEAIRQQLGLREVHLVGHSWGATVALEYLLTASPAGVRSVTLVGPLISTPRWIQDANALVEQLPEDAQEAIQAAKSSGQYETPEFEAANGVFEKHFGSRAPRKSFPPCESVPVRFNSKLYQHMWGPSEFIATGTLRDYDRVQQLRDLRLPTLFVVGEFDEVRAETVREFQARVAGSTVRVVPDAGHSIHRDQPRAFNEIIAEFINDAESR